MQKLNPKNENNVPFFYVFKGRGHPAQLAQASFRLALCGSCHFSTSQIVRISEQLTNTSTDENAVTVSDGQEWTGETLSGEAKTKEGTEVFTTLNIRWSWG